MAYQFLRASALLAGMAISCTALSAELLWFSDAAPKRSKASTKDAAGAGHAGKHQNNIDAVISGEAGDNLHSGAKRLWLRQGDDLAKAGYVADGLEGRSVAVLDAAGKRTTMRLATREGKPRLDCTFEEMGFRNAYLSDESVRDGVRTVRLAKAEMLYGSCCSKVNDMPPEQQRAISDPSQPLEIVREHEADEKLFTRIVSGDQVKLTVNRMGRPYPGASVTMLTQQGWQKKVVTDAQGRAEFTVIRDYFPNWSDFKRRTKETFVLVAEAQADEGGTFAGQPYAKTRYQATLSGKYQLSPYDYKSYSWGLGVTLFVVTFGGVGVYLYRRRRVKPFKEVRFNESA